MNREIKFRIWADNKFYNKCLVGNTNNTNDEKWTCPMVWLEKQKEWVHCDNGIICQYTGLHDKNGKEIYEGDIVKDLEYKIIGKIEYIEYMAGYFLVYGKSKCISSICEVEVIGNIYEDIELLGGEYE